MKEARWVGGVLFVLVGQLVVFSGTAAAQQDACRVGQELEPGEYCTVDIPGLNVGSNRFEVQSDGRACYGAICSGQSMNLNGFRASRIDGTSRWRIDALPPTVPALPPAALLLLMLMLVGGSWLHRRRQVLAASARRV